MAMELMTHITFVIILQNKDSAEYPLENTNIAFVNIIHGFSQAVK